MFKKQTYPVRLSLIIRSEGNTDSTDPEVFPKYYLYYNKTYEMPMPPSVGISIFVWKPIKIKEIHIRSSEVLCILEEQILPYDKFDELMKEYQCEFISGNWEEDKVNGVRPFKDQ